MVLLDVCRKNLVSSLRGEYVDFLISRFTFTIFSMATAFVLYRLNNSMVTADFLLASGSSDYLGFMIVGTALFGSTQGILLNVSRTLMTERREGTLEAVLLIPFPRWQYYGGNQLHQFMLTALDVLLALILSIVLGVSLHFNLPMILAGAVQLYITLYGLALIISLVMIILKDTFFIQNTIIPIILIVGGYLFPIHVLPGPLRILAGLLSIYRGVTMVRDGVLSGKEFQFTSSYLISLIPGILLLAVGFLLLPYIERRALENYLS